MPLRCHELTSRNMFCWLYQQITSVGPALQIPTLGTSKLPMLVQYLEISQHQKTNNKLSFRSGCTHRTTLPNLHHMTLAKVHGINHLLISIALSCYKIVDLKKFSVVDFQRDNLVEIVRSSWISVDQLTWVYLQKQPFKFLKTNGKSTIVELG